MNALGGIQDPKELLAAAIRLHRAGLQHLVADSVTPAQEVAMAEAGDIVAALRARVFLDEVGEGLKAVSSEGAIRLALRAGLKEFRGGR